MPKRILQGVVTSNKADKTVTVNVERRLAHPVYGKIIRRTKKYHAHDESNACQIGDSVRIIECAPISKTKSWEVISGGEGGQAKADDTKASEPKAAKVSRAVPKAKAKK